MKKILKNVATTMKEVLTWKNVKMIPIPQADPARIEPDERDIFHLVMGILETTYEKEFKNLLKIAVFHHNVVPFVNEEVKSFDLMLNAGQIKKELVEADFQVVLHGHKHHFDILSDTAISDGGCLKIISGNTIGGGQASGLYPGFNIINWNPDEYAVSVQSIKLSNTGSPRKEIEKAETKKISLKDKNSEIITETNYLEDINLENIDSIYETKQKRLNKEIALAIFDKACELFKNNHEKEVFKYFNKVVEFDPGFHDGNCNITNSKNLTPLHMAVTENNKELVKLFLANKADINSREGTFSTPLHLAAHRDYKELVELFINNKAEINIQNDGGDTPLHLAIGKDYINSARLLLEKGANVNIRNNTGYTPLHLSVNSLKGVTLLLEYKAKPDIKNNNGFIPLNLAEKSKVNSQIIELLRKHTQIAFENTKKTERLPIPFNTPINQKQESDYDIDRICPHCKKEDSFSIMLNRCGNCGYRDFE